MFRSPLFARSPRPNQDPFGTPASQSSSRFGTIRTMFNGSSLYSQSPAPSTTTTPKPPFLGIFRRDNPSDPTLLPTNTPRASHESHSPFHAQHTAGSYIRTINPHTILDRHPADVPLPHPNTGSSDPDGQVSHHDRHPADVPLPHPDTGSSDPDAQVLADEINGRRRRRRRKHRQQAWVRRRRHEPRGNMLFVRGSAARGKVIACSISGVFLLSVLAIYLAIALTNRTLNQEIHILFILLLLSITIFFCHALIRLCMLLLHPSPNTSAMPDMLGGGDGFQPIVPIRVHLARDEEAGEAEEHEKDDVLPPPPPAYGLWRSSVRVDPNLLHWQRAAQPQPQQTQTQTQTQRLPSASGPAVPRPPSYVSEDGVSYVADAVPRSMVGREREGVSDVHPAWRVGYAVEGRAGRG